mmetsp:Transcript_62277/g.151804  ORF Transcript_62277/g.151804 Transcript_62277/m.151804 type:complete len:98 (-) Transcript_62277:4-297(-)
MDQTPFTIKDHEMSKWRAKNRDLDERQHTNQQKGSNPNVHLDNYARHPWPVQSQPGPCVDLPEAVTSSSPFYIYMLGAVYEVEAYIIKRERTRRNHR